MSHPLLYSSLLNVASPPRRLQVVLYANLAYIARMEKRNYLELAQQHASIGPEYLATHVPYF